MIDRVPATSLVRRLVAVVLALASANDSANAAHLLYCGLATNGWQVFRHDLQSESNHQLTHSPGDKRQPRFVQGLKQVVFRDSAGVISTIKDDKETAFDPSIGNVYDFEMDPTGDRVWFTRETLGSGADRFFLWLWESKTKKVSLFFRPELGSIRQPSLSPDGKHLVATRVLNLREALLIFPVAEPGKWRVLTPPEKTAVYPRFTHDSKAVLAGWSVGDDNFDMFRFELDSGTPGSLVATDDDAEVAPSPDSAGQTIYFERRSESGPEIHAFDNGSRETRQIPTGRPASEPFWYDQD